MAGSTMLKSTEQNNDDLSKSLTMAKMSEAD